MIIAQLAAAEGRHVISLYIGSAYLNAKMPKDDPSKLVFMAIAPIIANILTDIDRTYKKFLRPNGSIIVTLDQALYGCIESALLWYKELSSFLASISFTPNPYEICILNKKQPGGGKPRSPYTWTTSSLQAPSRYTPRQWSTLSETNTKN
jgi:hypothetical protein